MTSGRYWDGVLAEWLADERDALWRRHADALHMALVAHWLDIKHPACILKTDLFDEAVSEGLGLLGARSALAVGMDLSWKVARTAQQRLPVWKVIVADVRRLPFADATFDAIVSNSTLDHFDTPSEIATALGELHRVLRPGGRLLLTLDNAANPIIALRQALPWRLLYRWGIIPYALGATVGPSRLCRMLEDLSFCILETRPILHVPRLFAMRCARRLRRASSAKQTRFLERLARWERLSDLPSRWVTGYFIAILASKEEN